ncbi:hypothetical protein D3C76_1790010 [compost metagenome]
MLNRRFDQAEIQLVVHDLIDNLRRIDHFHDDRNMRVPLSERAEQPRQDVFPDR